MKVAIYHKSVPNNKSQEKIDILKNFSLGIAKIGDQRIDIYDNRYQPSDVGVIQGWITEGPIVSPHLKLRQEVIKSQLQSGKHVVAADSNLFLYNNTANPLHYLRYSFNGVFPSTGNYCDKEINPDRWKKISSDLKITLKDYRTQGTHILLCLQRNSGWSMGNVDVQTWANETITTLKKYTDRPIIIRPHPGDKNTKQILQPKSQGCHIKFSKAVRLSQNEKLTDDLKDCWAAINYNSSPVVGAAIEGIPVFVSDPYKSQCSDIANTDLSTIENPILYDRQQWVQRISMFHWNFDELKSGQCWEHMRKYI